MDQSDEELLAACGRDRAAFGVFYERHERSVLGFFGAVTRRPELAADLTAETFAAALEGAAGFDASRGVARMWLFGIARNVLSGSARRGRVETAARRRIGLETLVLEPTHVELIEGLVAAEGDAIVDAWLADLPRTRPRPCAPGSSTSATTRTSRATCACPKPLSASA